MNAETTGQRAGDLTWDEAVALARKDRDQLVAELRAAEQRPFYEMRKRLVGGFGPRRWAWEIADTTGAVLASGGAWTEKAMYRRRYRAYLRVLGGSTDGRAES